MSEPAGPQRWLVVIADPGVGWLSANGRKHWTRQREGARAWRQAAALHARSLHLPRLQRAHLLVTFHHATNRRRDAANLAPTVKAVVDGLVDAHVLPDDDDAHLLGPDLRTGPRVDPGRPVRLSVLVTALAAGERDPLTIGG